MNTENTTMTNDCKTCPVSTGTHKPAEAVHQIDEPQAEALRLAQYLEQFRSFSDDLSAAAELRAQHARIAELEQRLEIDPRHRYDGISARDATIEAQDERIAELESQLAAAQQAVQRIKIDFKQATELLAMFGGEPTEYTLVYGEGHGGRGLYVYGSEYPEDGAGYLGESDAEAVPATHPTQQGLADLRWQIVHDHISGEYIAGRACFVVQIPALPGANIMRGSVAEHFTKAVDAIAAQAKQGGV